MNRITIKDVKDLAKHLSEGKDIKIDVRRQYDYQYDYIVLDLLDSEGNLVDVLKAGLTKREAYSILSAIQKFNWIKSSLEIKKQVSYLFYEMRRNKINKDLSRSKFKIKMKSPEGEIIIVSVKGKLISLVKGIDTFISRAYEKENEWTVSELLTGRKLISSEKTQKKAIQKAKEILLERKKEIMKRIAEITKKEGVLNNEQWNVKIIKEAILELKELQKWRKEYLF